MPRIMITLARVQAVIAAALAKGCETGLKPLTLAVLDPGQHPGLISARFGNEALDA